MIGTLSHFGPVVNQDPLLFTKSIMGMRAAVTSRTTGQVLSDYPTLARPYYNALRPKNVYSVGAGHNDQFFGVPVSTAWSNLQSIINLAKADGFTVVVYTIISGSDLLVDPAWRPTYNQLIRDNAAGMGYLVADAGADAQLGCTSCWQNTTLFADGNHLTAAGYYIKGGYMATQLASLGFHV